jgi:hypothetical protein
MNRQYLRQLVRESVNSYLAEAENEKNDKRSKGAKQVKAFLTSLERSPLAKKLKTIDTNAEKIEILVKFAEIIDFPKDKISKLVANMREV